MDFLEDDTEPLINKVKQGKHIYLAFFRMDQKTSPMSKKVLLSLSSCFINGTCNNWTNPFVHVEIVLDGVSYVCKHPQPVYSIEKSPFYKRKGYEKIRSLTVSEKKFKKIKKFLDEQIGKPFNEEAFYCNFTPVISMCFKINNDGNKWFCSELVTVALQMAGVVDIEIEPYLQTPQSLYDIVKYETKETNRFEATENMEELQEKIKQALKN